MKINNHYKFVSLLLILLSILSFFIGFIYGENSAGAGTLQGDFDGLWKNLQTFLNNDIFTALKFTAEFDPENYYKSSRPPLIYILHKLFNPFIENKIIFIKSVFVISLLAPVLFYLCLKQKFKSESNLLLILISSTILLSPYFRTSAYWGLEENYGLICLLISFLFFNQFLSNTNHSWKDYYLLFFTTFFSSLCIYFDQKLIIIPLICFFHILFSGKNLKLKILLFVFYFIFSLPYIYLAISWESIIPSIDAQGRGIGKRLYFEHIGYAVTIIAFYLFPFLLYKNANFFDTFKNFFSERKNYYFISLFFIYLLYLLIFYNYDNEVNLGKGFIHKTALLLFKEIYIQEIFIYFSFFVSWIIVLIYVNNNLNDKLIIFYFILLSIIISPILQEYFDPLIILMAFTFFGSRLIINFKYSILFFLYFSVLLILSNVYYYNLLS